MSQFEVIWPFRVIDKHLDWLWNGPIFWQQHLYYPQGNRISQFRQLQITQNQRWYISFICQKNIIGIIIILLCLKILDAFDFKLFCIDNIIFLTSIWLVYSCGYILHTCCASPCTCSGWPPRYVHLWWLTILRVIFYPRILSTFLQWYELHSGRYLLLRVGHFTYQQNIFQGRIVYEGKHWLGCTGYVGMGM